MHGYEEAIMFSSPRWRYLLGKQNGSKKNTTRCQRGNRRNKRSWSLTKNTLFMKRCIAAIAEKIAWHQAFSRSTEVEGERVWLQYFWKQLLKVSSPENASCWFCEQCHRLHILRIIMPGENLHLKQVLIRNRSQS